MSLIYPLLQAVSSLAGYDLMDLVLPVAYWQDFGLLEILLHSVIMQWDCTLLELVLHLLIPIQLILQPRGLLSRDLWLYLAIWFLHWKMLQWNPVSRGMDEIGHRESVFIISLILLLGLAVRAVDYHRVLAGTSLAGPGYAWAFPEGIRLADPCEAWTTAKLSGSLLSL